MSKQNFDPKTEPAKAFKYNTQTPSKYYVSKENQIKNSEEVHPVREDKFLIKYIDKVNLVPDSKHTHLYKDVELKGSFYKDIKENMWTNTGEYNPEPLIKMGKILKIKPEYNPSGSVDTSDLRKKIEKKLVFEK